MHLVRDEVMALNRTDPGAHAKAFWADSSILPCIDKAVQVSLIEERLPKLPSLGKRHADPRQHSSCLEIPHSPRADPEVLRRGPQR